MNGGTLQVDGGLPAGSAVAVGHSGTLSGTGTINGTVAIGNGGNVAGSGTFTSVVSGGILGGGGVQAVPEPGTVALLLAAALGLFRRRRN